MANSPLRLLSGTAERSNFRTLSVAVCVLAVGALTLHSQSQRGFEQAAPNAQQEANGGYYALVIGINDYPAPLPTLKTAVHDAEAVADLLREQYGFQVTTLIDQEATRDNILDAMAHFRKRLDEGDSLLIYYAGHGSFDREADKAYWLPIDADPDPLVTSHDISADDITTEVRAFPARHVLIVSDSCFSGDLSRASAAISPSDGNAAYIRRMLRAPSRTIMASGSDEPVSDSGSAGHSVFAALLLQAMQTRPDSAFTAEDLFVTIRKSVLARSGQSPQYAPLRNSVPASASLDNGDFVFTRAAASALAAPPPTVPLTRSRMSVAEALNKAVDLERTGRYSEAFPLLATACDGGGASGCTDLGYEYETGNGAEKDLTRAVALYRKGCDGGNALGCTDLGTHYEFGTGVEKDPAQAVALYRKACGAGQALGCTNLGVNYENGTGVEKDPAQAVLFYRKGCDGGSALGCTNLGVQYEDGKGVERNPSQAVALYRKACDGGDPLGCTNLGYDYENGIGIEKDLTQAVALYRKACEGDNALGCRDLGTHYENGTGVDKDLAQAVALYRKACGAGEPRGCNSLGYEYEAGTGVEKDLTQAAALYRKACDAGEPLGCTNLGNFYKNGTGVETDPSQAVALFRKACEASEPRGCTNLGYDYENGAGVEKDLTQAVALYRKACEGGNALGCTDLGTHFKNGTGVEKNVTQAVALYRKACDAGEPHGCAGLKRLAP